MFRILVLFIVSMSSCGGEKKEGGDSTIIRDPVIEKPIPENPELKVDFVSSYTDSVTTGSEEKRITVQWSSVLNKSFSTTQETYSFFHLEFQSQKLGTESLGDGDFWGWVGCFNGVSGCSEFESIDAVLNYEKLNLVVARGLDPSVYTEARFLRQLDKLTVDDKVFHVLEFEIKKQGRLLYDRVFYHLIDSSNLVVLRVETEFILEELWPEIQAAINNTVESIRIES